MTNYQIRVANKNDMQFIIELARLEGWNPGLHDGECFYFADKQGFLIGELNGIKIGCISAVKYGNFGFVGLYIVKPEFRGFGYGMALWKEAMSYLSSCNIGLDGVVAQQENYRKSGFKLAHRNMRYEFFNKSIINKTADENIVQVAEIDFNRLLEYDLQHFPSSRVIFCNYIF